MDYSIVVLSSFCIISPSIWLIFKLVNAKTPPPLSGVALLSGAISFFIGVLFAPDTGSALLSAFVGAVFLGAEALDLVG